MKLIQISVLITHLVRCLNWLKIFYSYPEIRFAYSICLTVNNHSLQPYHHLLLIQLLISNVNLPVAGSYLQWQTSRRRTAKGTWIANYCGLPEATQWIVSESALWCDLSVKFILHLRLVSQSLFARRTSEIVTWLTTRIKPWMCCR